MKHKWEFKEKMSNRWTCAYYKCKKCKMLLATTPNIFTLIDIEYYFFRNKRYRFIDDKRYVILVTNTENIRKCSGIPKIKYTEAKEHRFENVKEKLYQLTNYFNNSSEYYLVEHNRDYSTGALKCLMYATKNLKYMPINHVTAYEETVSKPFAVFFIPYVPPETKVTDKVITELEDAYYAIQEITTYTSIGKHCCHPIPDETPCPICLQKVV